jgi:hypothetical protein
MSLINCKECKKEISSKAKNCPQCGAKVPAKFSVIKLIGGLVFGGIALLFFMVDKPGTGITSQAGEAAAASKSAVQALTATNVAFTKSKSGNRMVTGTLLNTTGKKLSYVQVEINLFDGSGTQVGSTLTNVSNLDPGVSWNFEAVVLGDRAKSATVAGITSL